MDLYTKCQIELMINKKLYEENLIEEKLYHMVENKLTQKAQKKDAI